MKCSECCGCRVKTQCTNNITSSIVDLVFSTLGPSLSARMPQTGQREQTHFYMPRHVELSI